MNGYDPQALRTAEAFKQTIGVVFGQRSALWWDIAVRETFRLLQRMYQVPEAEFRRQYGELVAVLGIGELLDTPVRKLSLGQRMRCGWRRRCCTGPRCCSWTSPPLGWTWW